MSLKDFFKERHNLIFLAVLAFALYLRLKYFNINTALWWDEAEYLSMAKHWAFDIPFEISSIRPVLFSYFASVLYRFGATEFTFRVVELLFSFFGVFFVYLLGKELFNNKKIALFAAFIASFFFLNLFYTARILVGLPTATLWLLAVYLFWKGYVKNESSKYLWAFGIVFGLGVLTRFPFGLLAVILLAYLLITEKFKFLLDKRLWITGLISFLVLIPYFIYYGVKFHGIGILDIGYGHGNFFAYYLNVIPNVLFSPLVASPYLNILFLLMVAGLIFVLFDLALGFNLVQKDSKLRVKLFLVLWIIIPFVYFSTLSLAEDRYLFYIYPAFFYLISIALFRLYFFISKRQKQAAVIIILIILAFCAFHQLSYADNVIKAKADSYVQFKQAGLWIKENSEKDDVVFSNAIPQLSYYSERNIQNIGISEEYMNEQYKNFKPRYMVVSVLERLDDWAYVWPQEHQDVVQPVKVFFFDPEEQNPAVVIYEFVNLENL